jgi:peptidoglycan/LPS O-acetylase OafA/YrhL
MSAGVGRHFAGIDLIRFFAASYVCSFHLTFSAWADPYARTQVGAFAIYAKEKFSTTFSSGWVGVEIFFVISGFVIALSAEGRSPLAFAKSRLFRLLPTMWVAAPLLSAIWLASGMPLAWVLPRFLGSLAFQPLGPWVSGVFWTLQVEIVFYGLICILLLYGRFNLLEEFAALVAALSGLFWIIYWVGEPLDPGYFIIEKLARHQVGAVLLLRHGAFFALGIFLWSTSRFGHSTTRFMFISTTFCICILEIVQQAAASAEWTSTAIDYATPICVWAVAVTVLAVSIKYTGRWKYAGIVRMLGLLTYPFYLLHQVVGLEILALGSRLNFNPTFSIILATTASVLLSYATAAKLDSLAAIPLRRAFAYLFPQSA